MPSTLGIVASHRTASSSVIPMTGLVGWWDADDASTFTYSSGTVVSQWRDKSGSNRHLAQGTVGNQPIRNGTQNLRATVVFDGTNDYLDASTGTHYEQFFVVAKYNLATFNTYAGVVSHNAGDSDNGIVLTGTSGGTSWFTTSNHSSYVYHYNGVLTPAPRPTDDTWACIGLSSSAAWIDPLVLRVGMDRSNTRYWTGEVAEVIGYNRVLSTVERQQVESYLTAKWITPAAACTDVLAEPFNNFTAAPWVTGGTTLPTIVAAGRTGTAARCTGAGRVTYTIPALSQSEYLTVGFAYKTTTIAGGSPVAVELRSDADVTVHNRVVISGSGAGAVIVQRGAGLAVLASSSNGVIVANTWNYIELQIKLHDTTGTVTVRVNGTPVATATNVDTKNAGTKTVYDSIRLVEPLGFSAESNYYDDLYISTGSGCAFKGSITIP